jgi:hypothetical protein
MVQFRVPRHVYRTLFRMRNTMTQAHIDVAHDLVLQVLVDVGDIVTCRDAQSFPVEDHGSSGCFEITDENGQKGTRLRDLRNRTSRCGKGFPSLYILPPPGFPRVAVVPPVVAQSFIFAYLKDDPPTVLLS